MTLDVRELVYEAAGPRQARTGGHGRWLVVTGDGRELWAHKTQEAATETATLLAEKGYGPLYVQRRSHR